MKRSAILVLIACAATVTVRDLSAHHSFAAIYDTNRMVSVKGTITKVVWSNPHVRFFLDAKGSDGTVATWVFELHSPNDMIRGSGWTRDTLKAGDVLTVQGAGERGGANRAFMFQATFADGRKVLADREEAGE